MNKEELKKHIISGEIIISTKELIREAVKENISYLLDWDDFHDFSKGASRIDDEKVKDICDEVIDYLTE